MNTVSLTIDGRPITVAKGKTVLQAAIETGITVPYYCYHPGLGVDGSCRVCVVKVEKMPKLQTACSTVCTDGMVVETRSREVVDARAGIFEFLLVNHPLDCPVCDKGGECPLQDFAYTFGPARGRSEFPRRTFDGEGVGADVDFGPTLMLNRNRCILCTRCVRFMRDVADDAQINIVDRGFGSEIATFQEEGVHSLLSGNLMDVCPVGAITTRDYRFKSRPWDNLQAIDTICTFCSKGCNTTAWLKAKPEWARGSRLIRFTPRLNPAVNGYWMCDLGRFDYHWIEGNQRLRRPLARRESGTAQPLSWQELLPTLRDRLVAAGLDRIRFLLSGHASHEELFLFRRIASACAAAPATDSGRRDTRDRTPGDATGDATITVSWRFRKKPQSARAAFQVPPVDAPNVHGARLHGLVPGHLGDPVSAADLSALREAIEAGHVGVLYVFDPGPEGSLGDVRWLIDARRRGTLPLLVVQGVILTDLAREADFVLPGASLVEKEASYTNETGRLQGTARVLAPPGEAMDDWHILVRVGAALGASFDYSSPADIRADLARRHATQPELAGVATLAVAQAMAAAHWLEASNPSERWKWDVLFRDLPPVKGAVDPRAIPLREVKS